MKFFNFLRFLMILSVLSCGNKEKEIALPKSNTIDDKAIVIRDTIVNVQQLEYDPKRSIWSFNKIPYSGFATSLNQDNILIQNTGFLNGKKEREEYLWYPDGHLRQIANYKNGRLHGEKKVWSPDPDHILISHLNYLTGKPHGEQLKWYSTGELFKKMNLNMGREEGHQQAFRKNGDLYANYEAKNGRIFGLKKAALCFGLENQKMNSEK